MSHVDFKYTRRTLKDFSVKLTPADVVFRRARLHQFYICLSVYSVGLLINLILVHTTAKSFYLLKNRLSLSLEAPGVQRLRKTSVHGRRCCTDCERVCGRVSVSLSDDVRFDAY